MIGKEFFFVLAAGGRFALKFLAQELYELGACAAAAAGNAATR